MYSSKLFEPKTVAKSYVATPAKRRLLVQLAEEIAREKGYEMSTMSGDWIICLKDPATRIKKYIWGYNFDINSSVSSRLCIDKSASSDVLGQEGVPCIEHKLFLTPKCTNYVSDEGVFTGLFEYAARYNNNIVLKPKDGTGGKDVFHCRTKKEIEAAALNLFQSRDLVASPYEEISDEFRVVVLNGEVKFMFKKEKFSVVGNGQNTVRELYNNAVMAASIDNNVVYDTLLDKSNISRTINFDAIPKKDEQVPLVWKHNLASGANATTQFSNTEKFNVSQLALQAARAVNINFASIDVVETQQGYKIMEINSGVMLQKVTELVSDGIETAKSIYKAAIESMFAPKKTKINSAESDDGLVELSSIRNVYRR